MNLVGYFGEAASWATQYALFLLLPHKPFGVDCYTGCDQEGTTAQVPARWGQHDSEGGVELSGTRDLFPQSNASIHLSVQKAGEYEDKTTTDFVCQEYIQMLIRV
jgi:hypothetical protein